LTEINLTNELLQKLIDLQQNMEPEPSFIDSFGGLGTILGVLIAFLTILWTVKQFVFEHILDNLLDESSKDDYREKLESNRLENRKAKYKNYLASSLSYLDNKIGSSFSYRALDFSIFFALVYSFLSFFIF